MEVVALAGGIGAGKFLRGLSRIVRADDLTVILNVADDVVVHGLHVSPDPDSVTYWLGDAFDRERGWGRRDETFRATEELRAFGAPDAWFNLGDLDLATHVVRTAMLREGATMSEAIAHADVVVLPPSNPVVSLGPILAVPGVREGVRARRAVVAGVSGIVGGAPLAGMADKLMPVAGLEVTAAGAAAAYEGLLAAWVVDERDRALAGRIERTGVRVVVTDTVMRDDDAAERLAAVVLDSVT
jgi:LPPG:FO 2-phospho-L-lactate transferase